MALTNCGNCMKLALESFKFCPYCGNLVDRMTLMGMLRMFEKLREEKDKKRQYERNNKY